MMETTRSRRHGVLMAAFLIVAALAVVMFGSGGRDVPNVFADDRGLEVGAEDSDDPDLGESDGDRETDEPAGLGPQPGPEALPPVIEMSLSRTRGRPLETVAVELRLFTDARLESLSIAIDFDESALEFRGLRPAVLDADGAAFEVTQPRVRYSNENSVRGDQDTEGWLHIELVPAEEGAPVAVNVDSLSTIFQLYFRIKRVAEPRFASVRFQDIGPVEIDGREEVLRTAARVEGDEQDADRFLAQEDVDDGGVVIEGVIGEVGFFLRGDANMDCQRDVSDAVKVLQYLFLGQSDLPCHDAADSDDNALLDLSDPMFTLNWLFGDGRAYPRPYEELEEDPTHDEILYCDGGFESPGDCGGSGS